MNSIFKLILVIPVAVALVACDSGEHGHAHNGHDHDGADGATHAHESDAGQSGDSSGAESAGEAQQSDSPADNTAGGSTSVPVNALSQTGEGESEGAAPAGDAAEGEASEDEAADEDEYDLALLGAPDTALRYWIKLMGEGDFFGVLFASDPGSTEYASLLGMAESMEAAREADDPQKRMVVPLIEGMFCQPWIDAEFIEVEGSEGRVRYLVTWANGYEVNVDVNQLDEDVWRVLVTNEMLQPDRDADPNDLVPPQPGGEGDGN